MDIADQSSSAILRPGLIPRWRAIFDERDERVERMLKSAARPCTFGDTEILFTNSAACCGALFVGRIDGSISRKIFWQLEYFFARDGAESRVFEYDRFHDNFVARRLDGLHKRAYHRA